MPKLLQINVCVNQGSTGRIAEQIGEAAISCGWDSYIAYGRGAGKSNSKTIKIGSKIGICIHALLTRLTDRHGLFSTRATRKLVKQIEEIKPDIIHLHNIHGYYLNYKVLFEYLNQSNIPLVWTLHDCWTMTGHCSHFISIGCEKWKTQCSNCEALHIYPKSWADASFSNFNSKRELFSANKNIVLVPVSTWISNFLAQSYMAELNKKIIHNGVDITMFKPDYIDNESVRTIIGVSSVWDKSKGLYDFYELRDRLSDDYRIILVGLTPKQIRELPVGIQGITRTDSIEDLVRLYSNATVFVNPTYADTYPTVNLESIACGTPVITYRTGGSPESITEQTGVVVDQGDIEGIIKAIYALEKQNRDVLRSNCRAYAEKYFDKNKCFKKYLELYEEIIRKNK